MKLFKNCKTLTLAGALALLLAGCGPSRDEAVAVVGAAMKAGLETNFAAHVFEDSSHGEALTPVTVFRGKHSKILALTEPKYESEVMGGGKVVADGLAVTRSGRYFSFNYTSSLRAPTLIPFSFEPCIDAGCRYLHGGREMSRSQAMNWLYYSAAFTPKLFEELFGEVAPPKRVEA